MGLLRNGNVEESIPAIEIDDLTYEYSPNTNMLINVLDDSNSASGFKKGINTGDDYMYDDFGNMIKDHNKGITDNIIYNHLNLPTKIIFAGLGQIEYVYNALGQKREKIVTEGSTVTTTKYMDGYQYENNVLLFFPHAEGYVSKEGSSTYRHVFNYTDHLGNIRLKYCDLNLNNTIETNEILEDNHYYPFGLKHEGYNGNSSTLANKYKYNGVEYQDELGLNIYATNFRQFDPAIGRFTSIDVMAEGDADLTPYRFGYNNPVLFSDPTGLWEEVDGGHKTTDKDEIHRIYAFLQNNQNASMDQIASFVKEDIAFMSQYNDGFQLTGIEVKNGKENAATMLRTQNEIAFYQHKTDYLYNSADARKRNLILDGKSNPISTELLRRESNGEFLPIDASNGIKYRGGHDRAMLINFAETFSNIGDVYDGGGFLKNPARSSKLTYTNLGSIKSRILTRLQITNISDAQIGQFKSMSFSEFHKNYSKFYNGYAGRGTYMTVMSRDFKYLKQL